MPATPPPILPSSTGPDRPNSPRVPQGRIVYAVGDVHGELLLLRALLVAIANDFAREDAAYRALTSDGPNSGPNGGPGNGRGLAPVLVMLGDYIDRGPDSFEVIEMLRGGQAPGGGTLDDLLPGFTRRYLRGNHEQALLDFLADPLAALHWLDFGGPATLRSYGVRPEADGPAALQAEALAEALAAQMPAAHRAFLETLEPAAVYGDYAFVHAGIRPGRPLARQTLEDLLWIRGPFLNDTGPHEKVVVHGHTIVPRVEVLPHRIAVDTGAYRSGRLSAVALRDDTARVLAVQRV